MVLRLIRHSEKPIQLKTMENNTLPQIIDALSQRMHRLVDRYGSSYETGMIVNILVQLRNLESRESKDKQKEVLKEIMKGDEELGLYEGKDSDSGFLCKSFPECGCPDYREGNVFSRECKKNQSQPSDTVEAGRTAAAKVDYQAIHDAENKAREWEDAFHTVCAENEDLKAATGQEAKAIAEKAIDDMAAILREHLIPPPFASWQWENWKSEILSQFSSPSSPENTPAWVSAKRVKAEE